ncbi:hypothetical protein WN51_04709 [Melipona quadrifasciata]|uniref:Uncharacterized protein n=1 Tax=Melipona quadrifasciata TaxID=166423 RepID=A0A0N0U7J4_9HYME|nr:hypothetical protein WN51_04709 [Melipona quadrifasciata]
MQENNEVFFHFVRIDRNRNYWKQEGFGDKFSRKKHLKVTELKECEGCGGKIFGSVEGISGKEWDNENELKEASRSFDKTAISRVKKENSQNFSGCLTPHTFSLLRRLETNRAVSSSKLNTTFDAVKTLSFFRRILGEMRSPIPEV